jgi:CheY-like chemotaxis protein
MAEPRALRVLVVDDDDAVRRVVRSMLERAGMDVMDVADAASALEQVAAASFDAAVVDHHMVGLSGPELALQLRERYPELRLLLFTGGLAEDEHAALFDAVVIKPVRPSALVEAVKRACAQR